MPERRRLRERLRAGQGRAVLPAQRCLQGARNGRSSARCKDLDLALHEAQSRWIRVDRARHNVPTNTGEFAARLAALKTRISALQARLAVPRRGSRPTCSRSRSAELSEQKERLEAYEVQARFALATMYDRAGQRRSAARSAPGRRPGGPGASPLMRRGAAT